ncbi:hypothetical protein HDV03_001522 [Kappamyces sp. JEL0829]|nr:hypothetical protein HDV03_001522 [Kappamyces sp. JEL0829]
MSKKLTAQESVDAFLASKKTRKLGKVAKTGKTGKAGKMTKAGQTGTKRPAKPIIPKTSKKTVPKADSDAESKEAKQPAVPPVPFNSAFVSSRRFASQDCWFVTFQSVEVIRRKSDDKVNASAILKAAKVPKPRRKNVLRRLTELVPFEKVDEGWHSYQGIYVPLEAAKTLAERWMVGKQLAPLFEQESRPQHTSEPVSQPDE